MRRDRSEAASADRRHAGALELDPARRLRVARRRHEVLLAAPDLERERTLSCLREAARPGRSGGRSRPRARAGRGRTPRARPRRARARRACGASCRCSRAAARSRATAPARAAAHAGGSTRCRSASRARSRSPRTARPEDPRAAGTPRPTRPSSVRRGHVLRGMDRNVDAPVEQRLLELLDEDAPLADLAERLRPVAVAGSRDRNEGDLDPRPANRVRRQLGLREREPASAASDADQHSRRPAGRTDPSPPRRSPCPRSRPPA